MPKSKHTKVWYVEQLNFQGKYSSALYHSETQPSVNKGKSGRRPMLRNVVELSADLQELSLTQLRKHFKKKRKKNEATGEVK